MFDWLVRIPGEQFLLIFPFFFVIVILAVRKLYGIGDSKFDTAKIMPKLNALEFAVLSGGKKRAVELVLFELYREGCISFDDKNRIILKHPPQFIQAALLPLGKKLYKEASKRNYIHQLTNISYSDSLLKNYIDPVFTKLQNLGLIGGAEINSRNLQIYWAGLLTWLAFGGIKLFYGIARSRPSGFLILELIIAFILYKALVMPKVGQLTKLGKRALEETNQSLASKKQIFIDNGQISDTPSVLLMAAFGVAAFGQIP
ncbi:MAG TPA: TIGR04222 domain-containing membrane protein, partial [Anaerolineales bacterium]|nr:TIGR04222 domain-containing membrane protein [Anaerolineales bacterium]